MPIHINNILMVAEEEEGGIIHNIIMVLTTIPIHPMDPSKLSLNIIIIIR
jgi:hypothetical protein